MACSLPNDSDQSGKLACSRDGFARAVPAHILQSELSLSMLPPGMSRMRFEIMPPCFVKTVITGRPTAVTATCGTTVDLRQKSS